MDVLQRAIWKNTHIEHSLKVTNGRCVQITTLFGQKNCFPFRTNTTRDGVQCWVRSLESERQDTKVLEPEN